MIVIICVAFVAGLNTFAESDVTVIDVQNISPGGSVGCNHIYEAKWDENYHWEQCWKCGNIINKAPHHLVVDSGIQNTCQSGAPRVIAHCDGLNGKCQYYEYLDKPQHVAAENYWPCDIAGAYHYHSCKNCQEWFDIEQCYDSNGNKLACGNSGTCVKCGTYWDGRHVQLETVLGNTSLKEETPWGNDETVREYPIILRCIRCLQVFGQGKMIAQRDTSDVQGRTTDVIWDVTLNPGVQIDFGVGNNSDRLIGRGYDQLVNQKTWNAVAETANKTFAQNVKELDSNYNVIGNFNKTINKKQGRVILEYKFKSLADAISGWQVLAIAATGPEYQWQGWTLDGVFQLGYPKFNCTEFTDTKSPNYIQQNVVNQGQNNVVVNNVLWQNKQTLQVEFYDTLIQTNYLETSGFIRFYDKDMNPLTDWQPIVKNGFYNNYQKFYKQMDIVAEIKGSQPVYVQCKDKSGNVSETVKVQVQNIDALAPRIENEEVLETSTEWSKYKDIDYDFIDNGVGQVKVQFNSDQDTMDGNDVTQVDQYKNATQIGTDEYERSYRFTGNVPGKIGATLYAKDALGNINTYRINIYNLDNTAPVIESCESYKNNKETQIEVTRENDLFESGQQGSGIDAHLIKFIKQSKDNKPTAPQAPQETDEGWVQETKFAVKESGWYFIYAKDKVGNISEPYAIYVDASTITYDANGGIGLYSPDTLKITDNLDIFQIISLRQQEFQKDGYKASGWNTQPDGTGKHYDFNEKVQLQESTTLYAEWKKIYTLILDLRGGQMNMTMTTLQIITQRIEQQRDTN